MAVDDWIKLVGTTGFPIVITCYVLIRLENTLKDLTATVNSLIIALTQLGFKVNDK